MLPYIPLPSPEVYIQEFSTAFTPPPQDFFNTSNFPSWPERPNPQVASVHPDTLLQITNSLDSNATEVAIPGDFLFNFATNLRQGGSIQFAEEITSRRVKNFASQLCIAETPEGYTYRGGDAGKFFQDRNTGVPLTAEQVVEALKWYMSFTNTPLVIDLSGYTYEVTAIDLGCVWDPL
jgi:hypothetical protein